MGRAIGVARPHLSPLGLLEPAMLMLAAWWVWIFTDWITNWLDPDRTPVRLMMPVLMLFGLVLSSSIPEAFENRGLIFALAFAAMQVGARSSYWPPFPRPRLR